jgi:3-oxoacyl-[acyl-carrier protein] reductase
MGRSIALTLAREGADVLLNYETRPERAQSVQQAIESMGRRAVLHQADVATAEGARSLHETAVKRFGQVDILVQSAGGAFQPNDVAELEPEHWQRVLAEEIHAALYLIPLVLPDMRRQRWGRVILIGGLDADDWREPDAPIDYPLGKNARHWLARTLGRQELKHGITVNAIAPATIDYVELDQALSDLDHAGDWAGRPAPRPQDAGELVAFLCSQQARFVSGAVIPVRRPLG